MTRTTVGGSQQLMLCEQSKMSLTIRKQVTNGVGLSES